MNIILAILLTIFSEIPTRQDEIILREDTDHLIIGQQTFVLEDRDGYYTIGAITKPPLQQRFVRSSQPILTFPPNDSFYWIKFNIRSTTDKKFIIFIDEAKYKSVDLYYKIEGETNWHTLKNGYSIPQDQKAIAHNFQVFPLSLQSGLRGEFYLRLQPQLLALPISIESQSGFFQIRNSRYNLILGLVLGIVFFIGVNNLGFYFSFGGPIRLLYFLTSFSFVLFSIIYNGHVFLISSFIYKNLLSTVLPLTFISQFLVVLYGIKFLQIKIHVPWLYKLALSFLVVLSLLTVVSLLTNNFLVIICVNLTGILSLMICLLMGFLALKRNNSIYRSTNLVYCWSYILFFLCFFVEMGHVYFAWDYFFTVRFIDVGFLCEATGLAIALNLQTGIDQEKLEEAKNKAQSENLLLISKQNQILEVRVNQRTFELVEKTKIAEQLSGEYKLQSEKLKEVNLVKDKLFSIISHDLRAPLRQLHGILNLTDKAQLSEEEIKGLLCQVRSNLGVNIQLTDNLLFWARSQMAGSRINCQDFVLYRVVETKFQFFQHSFDTKKILTSNRTHHELKIHSDENIVALVIHNLLANAIKFCGNGDTIIVGSELRENETIIFVSDTGVGMTAEDVQNILDNNLFTKLGTANEKGTGLGLKICKDLIQQLNGKLWIESHRDVGTTFFFSVPDKSRVQVTGNQGTLQISA